MTFADVMPVIMGALGFLIVWTLNGLKGSITKLGDAVEKLRDDLQIHGDRLTKLETRCEFEHGGRK